MHWPGDDEGYANQAFVETTPLCAQSVVTERLAVIGHEDDDRCFALTGFLQRVEDATDVLVDQLDRRPVFGLLKLGFAFVVGRGLGLEVGALLSCDARSDSL